MGKIHQYLTTTNCNPSTWFLGTIFSALLAALISQCLLLDSLVAGRCSRSLDYFLMQFIDRYLISCYIALNWKVQHLGYAKSTLVQVMVMARCCRILTLNILNMLNCFRNFWRYIHILNRIWYLVWPKPMKLTLEQYMFSVIHSTMPADALMTLGARVSAGTVTARKAQIFCLQHQKS